MRGLSPRQVADLRERLHAAVAQAEGLKMMHPVYAAEANAYRRVLSTLETL